MRKQLFETEVTVLRDTFRRLLRRNANANLAKLIAKTHPADLALLFRHFSEGEQLGLFKLVRRGGDAAEFLSELDESILERLLSTETAEAIADLLRDAGANIQAYVLGVLPEESSKAVIENLKSHEQQEVQELLAYPEDSAGSLMDTDVFTLPEDTLAKDAIAALQDLRRGQMVFYLYLTNPEGLLRGVISLRGLVTTSRETPLREVMEKNVQAVRPETDQEEVARLVARYNYLAVPVVDAQGKLLGIVTVDDVVDVIREEATEDFLQMAGVGKDREILLKSSWENARSRLPWLAASWIGGILAATIIDLFDTTLQSIIALAAFIPVVIGMGGNIGTQSSTIVVRGIATGRVTKNAFSIIFKELRVGLMLGAFYGALLGLVAWVRFLDQPALLGVVVGLSICVSMVIATTIGALTPLFLARLDIDPAIATGPFVTTSIDILGVFFYFVIANSLLPIRGS